MSVERRIRLNQTMILRLKVAQRDRPRAVFGEEDDRGAGRIEEQADSPRIAIGEIGEVSGYGNGGRSVDDDIGLGEFLHESRLGHEDIAVDRRKAFVEKRFQSTRQRKRFRRPEVIAQQCMTREVVRKQDIVIDDSPGERSLPGQVDGDLRS
jgi:hypothetical protein